MVDREKSRQKARHLPPVDIPLVDQIFIDNESPCSVDLLRIPYDDSLLVESIDIEASSDPNVSPLSRWSSCLFDLADRIDDCCMGDVHILGILNSFDDSDVVVSAEEAEYRKLLRRKLKQKRRKERTMRKIKNPETNTLVRVIHTLLCTVSLIDHPIACLIYTD